MKTKSIILISIVAQLFFFFSLSGQPPDSLWQHHYGGAGDEIAFDVIEGDAGVYFVVGYTDSYGNGNSDAYILKLDNNGGVISENTYGGYFRESINSICPALYGGYVTTGFTKSLGAGETRIWLLWIDDEGDSLAARTYQAGMYDGWGMDIARTINQGYIVSATIATGFGVGDEIYLLNLDLAGDTIWTRRYGNANQDYGEDVIQTSDGGFLIAGRTYSSYTAESGDAWAIKTDENGDSLWTRKYGGNDEDMFNCVVETGNGYVFAGSTNSYGPGYTAVWAVRTDYNGDTIWARTYGGDVAQLCYTISEKENGHFVLCGYSSSFNQNNDVYLLEIDLDGNLVWEEHYGVAAGNEIIYGSCPTSDGGFIVAGKTTYYYDLEDEVMVLKLGTGNSGLSDKMEGNTLSFIINPNPVCSKASICFDKAVNSDVSIGMYNSLGIQVQSFSKTGSSWPGQELSWDVSAFTPGIYFLKVDCGSRQGVKKVVIQN